MIYIHVYVHTITNAPLKVEVEVSRREYFDFSAFRSSEKKGISRSLVTQQLTRNVQPLIKNQPKMDKRLTQLNRYSRR